MVEHGGRFSQVLKGFHERRKYVLMKTSKFYWGRKSGVGITTDDDRVGILAVGDRRDGVEEAAGSSKVESSLTWIPCGKLVVADESCILVKSFQFNHRL